MCNSKDAERLVQEAKKLEKDNPKRARENYLEAGEIMIYLSIQDKPNEKKYVDLANQLYEKAKALGGSGKSKGHHKITEVESGIVDANDFVEETKTKFDDIGGLEELKEEIRFKIIEPLQHPEIFSFYGKKMGGGIIMYGPPGCGKTLIAKATANEANATFFHVKSSDLKSKWVGETEKNIAELFAQARKKQPSVIFFDEFEALGMDRTSTTHGHDTSMVAQLLAEMDGMQSNDQQILLLAATNEPWSIDPALRREGRFGETLFIPPPDLVARESILKLHMKGRPVEEIDYNLLAQSTDGYSGADLKGLCESATDLPLKEYFKTKKQRKITTQDFDKAKKKMNSIVTPWLKKAEAVIRQKGLQESFKPMMNYIEEKLPASFALQV